MVMKTAAIIGAGVNGAEWAARFLLNGWDVKIYDPDPNTENRVGEILAAARYALPMLYDVTLPAEGTIKYCESVSDAVNGVGWIQESVPEHLETKHRVFQAIQEHCPADAIVASSSVAFAPAQLQRGAKFPEQILAIRSVGPVYLMPVCELISFAKNDPEHVDKATVILNSVGLHPECSDTEAVACPPVGIEPYGPIFRDDSTTGRTARQRNEMFVAILRALKARSTGAGALLLRHEATLRPAPDRLDADQPLETVHRTVPIDWTDYNGHMNESRYGQLFSDAADTLMVLIGADAEYIASGQSFFTVDIHIKFIQETHAAQTIRVVTRVLEGRGKKLRLFHEMLAEDGTLLASGEQLLLHVSLKTRRTCEPPDHLLNKMTTLADAHAALPGAGPGKN